MQILLCTTLGEIYQNKKFCSILYMRCYTMRPLKKKISITLDEDILKNLKCLSEESYRSLSQYINLVLKEHLKNIKK